MNAEKAEGLKAEGLKVSRFSILGFRFLPVAASASEPTECRLGLRPILVVALALVLASTFITGCSRSDSSGSQEKSASSASKEPRYPLTGEVLSLDAAQQTVRVRHDAIQGLMPAMTMDFAITEADAKLVKPGDRIRADLVRGADGEFRLERVWPGDKVSADIVEASAKQLRQDTHERGRRVYREVGETAPDFALYDQNGRVVQMSRFRGKQIVLNFIYTRCPVPTMCPAATTNMMTTQRLAREAGVPNLELVSITLDPQFDTPGILKAYADARGIDTTNFSFLTGPESAIKDLLAQFGVIAVFQGNLLNHTLTTLLIDENGKIIERADGSRWEPKDFVAKMKKEA